MAVRLTFLLTALVVGAVTRSAVLLLTYAVIAGAIMVTASRDLRHIDAKAKQAALMVILSLALMVPFGILKSATALVHFLVGGASVLLALLVLRRPFAYAAASRAILLPAQGFLLAYVWSSEAALPLEELLSHTSSNGITSVLILLQANHSAAQFSTRKRTSIGTSLVTLAICIAGYGRGSIIAAAIIVLVNGMFLLPYARPSRLLSALAALLLVAQFAYTQYGAEIVEFVVESTKIGAGLSDEPRERMINEYLARMRPATLLGGASFEGTSIASEFEGNPHNSYIRAHHFFGLPYLLAVLVFPILIIVRARLTSVTLFVSAMLIVVLARAFTEPLLFPTPFDFFYFSMCLLCAPRSFWRNSEPAPAGQKSRRRFKSSRSSQTASLSV